MTPAAPLPTSTRSSGCSARSPTPRAPPCARSARPPRWGARAFEKGANEVKELRALAREAPATAKPLRQLLESLDDRRRAIDSDPRGAINGPPANDPSNRGKRTGFTGLEAIWHFFFWQGLSINGFDDISHILRISVVLSEGPNGCSNYENGSPQKDPSLAEKFRQCNQYLGPNQPGVYTPDFTRGANAASLAREAGKPAKKVGERRKEGQPDAGAAAGPEGHLQAADHAAAPAAGPDRPPAQAAEDRHRPPRQAARG